MRTFILAATAAATLAVAAPSQGASLKVDDPTPTAAFTDSQGNAGYVEIVDDGRVRVCNENPDATPAGDQLTGYAYLSAPGESFANGPTYGNKNIGAGDTDGEGADAPNDCP